MVIGEADRPFLDRDINPADAHLAVLVDALDLPLAAVHERARISRVGQEVVNGAIARACPPDPSLPDRAARERLSSLFSSITTCRAEPS